VGESPRGDDRVDYPGKQSLLNPPHVSIERPSSASPSSTTPKAGHRPEALRCPTGRDCLLRLLLEDERLVQCFLQEAEPCAHAMASGHSRFCRTMWKFGTAEA